MKEKLELEVGIRVKVKEQAALSDEDKAEIKDAVLTAAKQSALPPYELADSLLAALRLVNHI
ncbi:hypothetical protein [Eikenella corrodens]|uniref:hypothetical protein n=1 Tax=Eikenella corrodens TaxID=539 RepID=UPI00129BB9F5|nr:hypothetical protein [Eikenella corrodens]